MKRIASILLLLVTLIGTAFSHGTDHPSIHDTVVGILDRLRGTLSQDVLVRLDETTILKSLTPKEKRILSEGFISFRTNAPADVYVFAYSPGNRPAPFWVRERGFVRTDISVTTLKRTFVAWKRTFDGGRIGLGVNALDGSSKPYFVIVVGHDAPKVKITDVYPPRHQVVAVAKGTSIYADSEHYGLPEMPAQFRDAVMIQVVKEFSETIRMLSVYRETKHPATTTPDQVVLTWSEDPMTTQTIQWRTSTKVNTGVVRYRAKGTTPWTTVPAGVTTLLDRYLVNDPVNHRYSVVARNLKPATMYEYGVSVPGSGV